MKRLLIVGDGRGRTWWIAAIVLVVASAVGWLAYNYARPRSSGEILGAAAKKATLYHCPMHPTYTSDKPGECPICGMTLVPVDDSGRSGEAGHDMGAMHGEGGSGVEPAGRAPITVTDTQRQMLGLKVAHAKVRNLSREIKTVGTVAYDPDLAVAQREFLESLRLGDASLAKASEDRLMLMGMSADQIADLKRTRRVQKNLYLPAPDGKVWIYGDIYEADIPYVKVGQDVEVTSPAVPNASFSGKIAAIDPVMDPKARTMRVRTEITDPEGRLKPNLYVDLFIRVPLGEALSVSDDALIWSDGEWYLFVDEGEGRLVPTKVEVGGRTKDYAQITSGISSGALVVESASFLIDAESQLKGTLKSMKGDGMKGMSEHRHAH